MIIKLYKILFDDNIVICDYNMFNFKLYLILKLWYIFNILIILKTLWINQGCGRILEFINKLK